MLYTWNDIFLLILVKNNLCRSFSGDLFQLSFYSPFLLNCLASTHGNCSKDVKIRLTPTHIEYRSNRKKISTTYTSRKIMINRYVTYLYCIFSFSVNFLFSESIGLLIARLIPPAHDNACIIQLLLANAAIYRETPNSPVDTRKHT